MTSAQEAKRICRDECPVRRECGDDAADHDAQYGIVAGFNTGSVPERRQLYLWLGRTPLGVESLTARCAQCGGEFVVKTPGVQQCRPCRQGFVPSGPVITHIEQLARTLTYREIGRRAGLSRTAIYFIRRQEYLQPGTAQRILAVEADAEVAS
jgi:hypothetical protein